MAKNSSGYYNDYIYFIDKANSHKKECEKIEAKKKEYLEQRDLIFDFKTSIIHVRVEVGKLKKYLQMVSVDGNPYDKGACDQNYKKLTEIYNYLDKVYDLIRKSIIELNEEYELNNSYYNNALQNKRRSYEYYLDALNREKSGSKKVGATK